MMRQFIRHPINIPIQVKVLSEPETASTNPAALPEHTTENIGMGGLAFHGTHQLLPGTLVEIHISDIPDPFVSQARVLWSREGEAGTELGVIFLSDDDAYRARMIEQICHIESYRRRVLEEQGRALTSQQAALEWVQHYAEKFPNPDA